MAGFCRRAVAQSVGAGCWEAGTPSIQMRHRPAGGSIETGTLADAAAVGVAAVAGTATETGRTWASTTEAVPSSRSERSSGRTESDGRGRGILPKRRPRVHGVSSRGQSPKLIPQARAVRTASWLGSTRLGVAIASRIGTVTICGLWSATI